MYFVFVLYFVTVCACHIETTMWVNAQRDGRLPNIGGALCSTPRSFDDAQYYCTVQ